MRFRFLFLLPRQGGAVFAIEWCLRLLRAIAERDRKCVLPLLGQSFRINVRVPHHQGRYHRVRHLADSQRDVFETFVTEIRLADKNAVAVFRERSVAASGVVAERDIA